MHFKRSTMIILISAGLLILSIAAYFSFNFLSNTLVEYLIINKPVPKAEVLIVESWIVRFKRLVPSVHNEFKTGDYRYILISDMSSKTGTCGPTNATTSSTIIFANLLIDLGIDSTKIKTSVSRLIPSHRTFLTARGAVRWLRANDPGVKTVNVCTAGIHGKKTWWAYKRSFGKNIKVGILSFSSNSAWPHKWTKRRCNTRWLLYNLVGFFYAKSWPISWVPDENGFQPTGDPDRGR
jgi:hypothetical protein